MNKTITILIGNSDNKLSQADWCRFINDISQEVGFNTELGEIHFAGGSAANVSWQNYAFVFNLSDSKVTKSGITLMGASLKERVSAIGKVYKQDNVAWVEGDTQLI